MRVHGAHYPQLFRVLPTVNFLQMHVFSATWERFRSAAFDALLLGIPGQDYTSAPWRQRGTLITMDINERLYVEIHPMEGSHGPHPHPITDGGFDPANVYKVLGMFNPSETSECYFVLSNPQRQIWFIPQRHVRAFGIIDSDKLMLSRDEAEMLLPAGDSPTAPDRPAGNGNGHTVGRSSSGNGNGHAGAVPMEAHWPGRLGKLS